MGLVSYKARLNEHHAVRSRTRLVPIEALEIRILLSSSTWTGNGNGTSWDQAANWAGNVLPDSTSDVVINAPFGTTIQGPTSATIIKSLKIESASLQISSPVDFTVIDSIQVLAGQSLSVAGTTLQAGILSLTDAALLMSSGTIRSSVINASVNSQVQMSGGVLDGVTFNGDMQVTNGVVLRNGLTLNGTIGLGDPANLSVYGALACQGSQTIGGSGTIEFISTNVQNAVTQQTADASITFGAGITVRGKTGSLGYTPQQFSAPTAVVINQGKILWESGSSILIPKLLINHGTLQATAQAVVNVEGPVQGGVIQTELGAKFIGGTSGAGVWDNVTINGDMQVTNGIVLRNGLTLNGTISLGDPSNLAVYGALACQGSQTIGGTGTIEFISTNIQNAVTQQTADASITFGAEITIRGKTGSLGYTPQQFSAPTAVVINLGTIQWTAGTDIRFGASLINNGVIQVGSTGLMSVGGRLVGGVISTQAGARISGGTLDGVTVNGDFQIAGNTQGNRMSAA